MLSTRSHAYLRVTSAPAGPCVLCVSAHSDRDLDTYHGEPHLHLGHDTGGSHDAYKRTPGTR
jgi:hypothetical protein